MTMKPFIIYTFAAFLLVGCSSRGTHQFILEEQLKNPLFAEWYYEELTQRMVELEIKQDPLLKDERKKVASDATRREALQKAKEAGKKQLQGMLGSLISILEETTGEVLYVDDAVYFGPDFFATPGISMHVFLTTVVDPRDVTFPDETAMDLGPMQSPYDTGAYPVPPVENPLLFRTVVLLDTTLNRIHGFAQLSPSF